jgi:hypothetical protein
MKCVRNIYLYTLNVSFLVLITFLIYLVLRVRGRIGAITSILLPKKNCKIPYSFLPSLFSTFHLKLKIFNKYSDAMLQQFQITLAAISSPLFTKISQVKVPAFTPKTFPSFRRGNENIDIKRS